MDDLQLGGALTDKRILLIGGAGFIGHHLALRLSREGAAVHVVDSLEVNNLLDERVINGAHGAEDRLILRRRLELLHDAGVALHCTDARDREALATVFDEVEPQSVVHLAAVAHAIRANKEPFLAFEHGMRSLASALDLSRKGVQRFVYLSSSMVYGNFDTPVANEDHQLRPLDVYGTLKVCGEEMVRMHTRVAGLPYTVVRPCALYGPRCISRRVTQVFLENARQGLPIVCEGDASDRIDFTYVDDLVDGLVLVLESGAAENETFNLTAGNARSLRELAQVVEQIVPGVVVEYRPRPRLQPRRGTMSIDKARNLLGYSPSVDLEDGLPRCLEALEGLSLNAPKSLSGFESLGVRSLSPPPSLNAVSGALRHHC